MKIVHICLSGLYMDGWGYQDNMIAKYHVLAGHEVTVIANRFVYDEKGEYVRTDKTRETDCNGVNIVRLESKDGRMQHGPAERVHYVGLYETLQQIGPDIIFLHNPQIMDTEDIARYKKENPASRLYVDSHSDYSNSGRNFLSRHLLHGGLWRYKVQKLVPYTEKFYGVLPARVEFLLERYHTPKDKTELLVMGMDDEKAENAATPEIITATREKLGYQKDDFVIVTGGKIDHAKRQTLLLLEAVKNINRIQDYPRETTSSNPAQNLEESIFVNPAQNDKETIQKYQRPIKLLLIGSIVDDMKEQVLSLCEDANIKYIGWLPADETYPYFAMADLVVFPGRHSVMWEQVVGQGLPMVVKYWEGTTHIDLGGNVRFLKEDSVQEIQATLEDLIGHPEKLEKMREVAKEKGAKVFSYREISRRCIGDKGNQL
ncbi:MAG: glycosyltransferase family 4 protein [Lachnospiraceae bacterium]